MFLDQNKIDEGVVMLKSAMTLEPLMPTPTVSSLTPTWLKDGPAGTTRSVHSTRRWPSTQPIAATWCARRGLLRDQALASDDQGAALLEQADEAIKAALDLDKGSPVAQTLAACIILDRGGDADQAEWFLNQSKKRTPTSFALVQKARGADSQGTLDDVERLNQGPQARALESRGLRCPVRDVEGQGQIFHAFEAIKDAKERSHKDSAARVHYEKHMTRLGALIESGARRR